jgi:AAA+ superfamily predicted ATPase
MANPRRPKNFDYVSRFDNIPPQLMPNITAKDYINILKESRWNNDYKNEVYKEFLGVKSIDEVVYADYKCSLATSLVLRYILPDFFKGKELNIDKIASIESDGEYAASYSSIEIAPNEMVSRLAYGDYFVSNETQKYIVHLEERYPDSFGFKIGSKKNAVPDANALSEEMIKYGEKHNFLKGQKIDPNCNFIKFDKKYDWPDLILSEKIKNKIHRNITNLIDSRGIYKKNGLAIKRGVVLSGNPGTGKTQLFKVLCNQIDWTICWVTPKHLENAKKVAQIIDLCKELSPTIMLLEDLDLYAGERSGNHNPALLGELMNQLDGVQDNTDIITIATTNNKEVLEKALLDRPGRFDICIDFPLPEKEERLQMIKVFSNGLLDESSPFLEIIAKEYTKKTGAQVRELVNMTIIFAIDEKSYDKNEKLIVKEEHIRKAMKAVAGKDFSKVTGFAVGASSSLGRRLDDMCLDD